MNLRKTLLYNVLGLPAYWRNCRSARAGMDVEQVKIRYGNNRRQYAVVVSGRTTVPGRYAFYFHGGAWTFGRPETFVPAAIPWLALGFTVVLPSYRRPPRVGLDGIVADCRSAIATLRPAEEITHLHVGGISAGAHLAALLALRPEWWRAAGWAAEPQRALLCAGPLSLSQLFPRGLFGRYGHLDPYLLLNSESPQLRWQLLHGTHDATVAVEHSVLFAEKLAALGQSVNFYKIDNGTHLDAGSWMFGGVGERSVRGFLGADAGAKEG